MFPDLLDLGFIHLHTYGALMAVGFLLSWHLIERLSGRKDLSNLLVLLMVAGVVGSRLAYVIEHWQAEFAAAPLRIIRVDQGGLMFYGGFILASLVFALWCRRRHERPLALLDLFSTVIPLAHACGRLGCFCYGCCYGLRSDSPLAVAFPARSPAWHEQLHAGLIAASAPRALPVLPTQLFEAAALLVLFTALYFAYRRFSARLPGAVAGAYLVGYGVIRFALEYVRGDPRWAWAALSISQLISLGIITAGAAVWGWAWRSGRRRHG